MPAKLLMVGDGPEKEKAEQLCEELNIQDKVIFFGNSHEINSILSYSDLFLLPSETESFGLAALEAMAWRVPIISSNSGGLPEVNINGFSGYLSNVGAIDEMAKNGVKILENKNILNEFKENAFKTAQKFSIQNILPIYEELYQKTINNSK
jgi:N-acetyl-alpha-D-glucosaminyl L-malate synthase BshA